MNKKLLSLSLVAMLLILPQSLKAQFNWPYKIVNGTAVTDVPARPAGQKDALNLVTPKLDVVRVGFVGLGMRGPGAVERWTHIPGTQIMALCDHEKDRAERCENILRKASLPKADIYYGEDGYKQLCERKDIDLVYIATDWLHHVPVAKYALEHGKHVAIEVPSAMNLHEIWDLINLAESKQLHCMILENCCYDFFELNTLNMAQKGLFGEILYVTGAYRHTLSPFSDFSAPAVLSSSGSASLTAGSYASTCSRHLAISTVVFSLKSSAMSGTIFFSSDFLLTRSILFFLPDNSLFQAHTEGFEPPSHNGFRF